MVLAAGRGERMRPLTDERAQTAVARRVASASSNITSNGLSAAGFREVVDQYRRG